MSSNYGSCGCPEDSPPVAFHALSKGHLAPGRHFTFKGIGNSLNGYIDDSDDNATPVVALNIENDPLSSTAAPITQASEAKPSLTSLQLRFLAAASDHDLNGLTRLLTRAGDVEEGVTSALSPSTVSLLESVTAEGDTALHLVAASIGSRDYEKFNRCAEFLYGKDKKMLSEKNSYGDTPLHCAARAGKSQLVSFLIDLAKDGEVQSLLRMKNKKNETTLHEAVRRGDKRMVKDLLRADPELASFPTNGISPLYLAIQLIDDRAILGEEDRQATAREEGKDYHSKKNQDKSMAQILSDETKHGFLSFKGPNGQNALHAAVLRGPALTRKLLRWNKDLTIQKDGNGSTPLHFAAGLRGALGQGSVCSQLLEANKETLYQVDNDGLYPIHVAASVGAVQTIALFLKECPGSAGLRAKGKTILHVAVENGQVGVVYQCMNTWLAWIIIKHECMHQSQQALIANMQDNDGDTALHLAVKSGSLLMFSALFANRKVDLNITNLKGQTPLDIARNKPQLLLSFSQNSKTKILAALRSAGAWSGTSRQDHFQKNYQDNHGLKSKHESKELERLKDVTQAQSITAVLIATVTFGAISALPGGYRADDHTNGGTPTLVGRYAFDAFMMANTLAFIFSAASIVCVANGGSPMFDLKSRRVYLGMTFDFLRLSVTCFIAAFALGVYTVLSPVAHKTAVAICVMSPLVLICNSAEFWLKWVILAPSYWVRKGPLWTIRTYIYLVLLNLLLEFWSFFLIFIWAAYGRTRPISKTISPVQPPSV